MYKDYEVLESLLSVIESIDGGCSTCINGFVQFANRKLARMSSPYRYVTRVRTRAERWEGTGEEDFLRPELAVELITKDDWRWDKVTAND